MTESSVSGIRIQFVLSGLTRIRSISDRIRNPSGAHLNKSSARAIATQLMALIYFIIKIKQPYIFFNTLIFTESR